MRIGIGEAPARKGRDWSALGAGGHEFLIGSRDPERARGKAAELGARGAQRPRQADVERRRRESPPTSSC